MENPKIGNLEAIAFFVIISINGILLSSSQFIVQQCSSSSLINALFVTITMIAIIFIFCLLLKNFVGNSLLDVSEYLGGRILKFIVGIVFIIYFICRVSFFLRKMSECLQILYYPMTNMIFIASLFCIAAGIIVSFKNNSIFKSAILLLPILLATIVLVFIGNSKNFHFENIYPILGNGTNATFLSGFTNVFAFCGLAYLFFLPSKLKNPEKLTKISIISVILSGIFLLFAVADILFIFGDVLNISELFPIYASVRRIEFGTFFQRLDAIFLLLCTLCFICTLSFNTYLITDILKNITNTSDSKPFIVPCLLIILGFALSIKQNSMLKFLENTFSKILFFVLAIIVIFIILISANIKKKMTGGKS